MLATGTPEQVAAVDESYTGQFLREVLPPLPQPPSLLARYTAPEEQIYLRTRATVRAAARARAPSSRILVVGPSYETVLLRDAFPSATVQHARLARQPLPLREHESHVQFDLNDPDYPELERTTSSSAAR